MLRITVPGKELYDEESDSIIVSDDTNLELEHSLVSLSKWEQIWEKPFLGIKDRTQDETYSYIECMSLIDDVDPMVFRSMTQDNVTQINDYISKKATATTFHEPPGAARRSSGEAMTAEIIYYWMTAAAIPFECQYWHLNRLLALIRVISLKNAPKTKMGRREQMQQQRMLNEQRRAQYGTKG